MAIISENYPISNALIISPSMEAVCLLHHLTYTNPTLHTHTHTQYVCSLQPELRSQIIQGFQCQTITWFYSHSLTQIRVGTLDMKYAR